MLNNVLKMVLVEIKLKAYYALLQSKLIYDILSRGMSSHGNKVT